MWYVFKPFKSSIYLDNGNIYLVTNRYVCILILTINQIFLSFQNTNYALLVFLPKNKDSSLDELLEKLPETNSEEITNTMKMKPIFVTMPCFQNTNITHLKTVLQEVCNYTNNIEVIHTICLIIINNVT